MQCCIENSIKNFQITSPSSQKQAYAILEIRILVFELTFIQWNVTQDGMLDKNKH